MYQAKSLALRFIIQSMVRPYAFVAQVSTLTFASCVIFAFYLTSLSFSFHICKVRKTLYIPSKVSIWVIYDPWQTLAVVPYAQ